MESSLSSSSSSSWYPVEYLRSKGQYGALMVTMSITPVLSMIASTGIMYMTRRRNNNNKNDVLRRLLFTLSLSDFCMSLSLLLNVWLVPEGTPGAYWAVGNHATCQTFGFLTFSLGMITSFINCFLSLYFLFSVRYSCSDAQIAKRYEKLGYAIVLVFPLTTGLGGIVTQSFNPQEFIGICQWDVYPWGCQDNPDLECTGEYSIILGWVSMLLLLVASLTGFLAVYLVYRTVRQRIRVARSYQNDFSNHGDDDDDPMVLRSKRVKMQAILYAAVYFNSFVWPAAAGVAGEMIDPERYASTGPYLLVYLCYLFYPLQGLGNFCVYTYPSIQRWRRAEPQLHFTSVVWRVLQGQEPRPGRRNRTTTRVTSGGAVNKTSRSNWSRSSKQNSNSSAMGGMEGGDGRGKGNQNISKTRSNNNSEESAVSRDDDQEDCDGFERSERKTAEMSVSFRDENDRCHHHSSSLDQSALVVEEGAAAYSTSTMTPAGSTDTTHHHDSEECSSSSVSPLDDETGLERPSIMMTNMSAQVPSLAAMEEEEQPQEDPRHPSSSL